MDYGHTVQDEKESPFFTAGSGSINPELNNVNPEDNLDTENWHNLTPDRDTRSLGNAANLSAAMPIPNASPQPSQGSPEQAQLGQIVSLDTPPSGLSNAAPATDHFVGTLDDSAPKAIEHAAEDAVNNLKNGNITPADIFAFWNEATDPSHDSGGQQK